MSTGTIERPTKPNRRLPAFGLAIVAIVVAAVAIGAVFLAGDDEPEPQAAPPLELSLGDGDGLNSCLVFDVAILADMSPAFEGTATAVDGDVVTLAVDRWFTGGDAAEVTLIGTAGQVALIGGIDFAVGQQYLITAADGQVNYCGYSGVATPELRAAFEQAFTG